MADFSEERVVHLVTLLRNFRRDPTVANDIEVINAYRRSSLADIVEAQRRHYPEKRIK